MKKLSEILAAYRIDRPDEWTMDMLKEKAENLEEENFKLECFNVDVIRCLKTLAFEHNHADIPYYMELAKSCLKEICKGNK